MMRNFSPLGNSVCEIASPMNITIQHQECQIGPYTLEEVNRRLREGKIKPDALAWQEGTNDWVPLKTIAGVGVTVSASPVQKPRVVKPKSYQKPLLWCAAALAVLLLIDIFIRVGASSRGAENHSAATQAPKNNSEAATQVPKKDSASGTLELLKTGGGGDLSGTVSQVLRDGVIYEFPRSEGFYYVIGDPKQRERYDGEYPSITVERIGLYHFRDVRGVQRTIPAYKFVR